MSAEPHTGWRSTRTKSGQAGWLSRDRRFMISRVGPSAYWVLDLDWYDEATADSLESAIVEANRIRARRPA